MLWLAGCFATLAGTLIYIEYGTTIPRYKFDHIARPRFVPRNGGELVYVSSMSCRCLHMLTLTDELDMASSPILRRLLVRNPFLYHWQLCCQRHLLRLSLDACYQTRQRFIRVGRDRRRHICSRHRLRHTWHQSPLWYHLEQRLRYNQSHGPMYHIRVRLCRLGR